MQIFFSNNSMHVCTIQQMTHNSNSFPLKLDIPKHSILPKCMWSAVAYEHYSGRKYNATQNQKCYSTSKRGLTKVIFEIQTP